MPAMYIAGLVGAEAALAFGNPYVGLGIHAALLCAIPIHFAVHDSRALAALALVPLVRILPAALPFPDPSLTFHTVGASLLLVATILAGTRMLGIEPSSIGFRRVERSQLLFGLSGLIPGVVVALFWPPPSALSQSLAPPALIAAIALAPLAEELLFRGLLQNMLRPAGGLFSVVGATMASAAFYLPTGSARAITVAAITGGYFGWWMHRTGALAGPILAHALLNSAALLLPLAL